MGSGCPPQNNGGGNTGYGWIHLCESFLKLLGSHYWIFIILVFPERLNPESTLWFNEAKIGVKTGSTSPWRFQVQYCFRENWSAQIPAGPSGHSQWMGWARLMSFKVDLRLVAVFDFLSRVWPVDSPLRPPVGSVHSLIKGNHCTVDRSRELYLIP